MMTRTITQLILVTAALLLSISVNASIPVPSSERELNRLQASARALSQAGQHREAATAWQQVQQLVHQQAGVNSLDQAPALAEMIELHHRQGQFFEAATKQRLLLRLYALEYHKSDLRMVPVLKQMAAWESARGEWSDAMFTYEDAIKVVKKNRKRNRTSDLDAELAWLNRAADAAAERMYSEERLLASRRW